MSRRCLVDRLPALGDEVELDRDASKHLLTVLRVQAGEQLLLFDGRGHEGRAEIVSATRRQATVRLLESPRLVTPGPRIHLGLALLKGPAMDLALRMATEAGMTDLHPIEAARSVARAPKLDRWKRILTSAATQCGRADLPKVHELDRLSAVLSRTAHVPDRRICAPGAATSPRATSDVLVLVGPEGGWTDQEVDECIQANVRPVGLTRWVLRASTAAVAAIVSAAPGPTL